MYRALHCRSSRTALLLVAVVLAACGDPRTSPVEPRLGLVADDTPGWERRAFEVYTQNVYLGGDTGPIFTIDFGDIPALIAATNVFWGQVQQSRAGERMSAIVDEIALRGPDVVGLQEVFRFAILDSTFQPVGGIDLLATIEAEIAARGLPYETEIVQEATSSALPMGFDPASGVTQWLAFTDRLVVLRRADVSVVSADHGTYGATVQLGPVEAKRAWARLSVDHDGVAHHFVTTHLEIQALAPVQAAQAGELLNSVVAGLDGITIIGGDLNSDAAAGPGDPSWTPTYDALRSAGFDDVWALGPRSHREPGFTCCQDPSLRNDPSELDERIDFVLVRASDGVTSGEGGGRYRAEVVGDEAQDRTAGGLWPSDHAGIAASLRLPTADADGS